MWCPMGFIGFRTIYSELQQLMRTYEAQAKIRHVIDYRTELQRTGIWPDVELREDIVRQELLSMCVEEFFSECPSLSVVSPSGVSLKIDERVTAYRDIPTIGWRHLFINEVTGTVSGNQWNSHLEAVGKVLTSMRDNIEDIDADQVKYGKYCELCKVEDQGELWAAFKNFDGWALCCMERDFEVEPEFFMSLDVERRAPAEPARPDNLKDEIIELFDNEKIRNKNRLWKEHFPSETRDAFRAAWSEAAVERPELSKSGAKSMNNKTLFRRT